MKKYLVLLSLLAGMTAYSQTAPDQTVTQSLEAQMNRERVQQHPPAAPADINRIAAKHVKLSGIFVQLAKTDHPLQLINPFAPPEYGSGAQNTAFDPITAKPSGLKLFAIEF